MAREFETERQKEARLSAFERDMLIERLHLAKDREARVDALKRDLHPVRAKWSTRVQVTIIRDMAILASESSESAAQWLYPMYGSLTVEECRGLVLGLNTWLDHLED